MSTALAHSPARTSAETGLRVPAGAERAARADLRRQIAVLERNLGELFAAAFPRRDIDWTVGAAGGPRVLPLAELERVRDALALRLADARAELAARADAEEDKRLLLERMIADPERYRWAIVSNEDIGERGCRHWHSRPRWGILGMLLGWWRVKLSSGCPLAGGLSPPPRRSPADRMAKKRRKPRPRRPAPEPSAEVSAERASPKAAPRRSRAPIDDTRPPAPWGSFPLVELVVLVALVMLGIGFFAGGDQRETLLITGFALGSLAGLELSVREHFGGYRSHTTLLAAAAGVVTMVATYQFTALAPVGCIGAGVAVAAGCGWLLVRAFRKRSGRAVKLR